MGEPIGHWLTRTRT